MYLNDDESNPYNADLFLNRDAYTAAVAAVSLPEKPEPKLESLPVQRPSNIRATPVKHERIIPGSTRAPPPTQGRAFATHGDEIQPNRICHKRAHPTHKPPPRRLPYQYQQNAHHQSSPRQKKPRPTPESPTRRSTLGPGQHFQPTARKPTPNPREAPRPNPFRPDSSRNPRPRAVTVARPTNFAAQRHVSPVYAPPEAEDPQDALTLMDPVDLCIKYGLVIVERHLETNQVKWVACKFCPVFGCKKRREGYIMAYKAPLVTKDIERHLKLEHAKQWERFSVCDIEGKMNMFQGKKLPPAEKFLKRIAMLKRNWGDVGEIGPDEKGAEKKKRKREKLETQKKGLEKNGLEKKEEKKRGKEEEEGIMQSHENEEKQFASVVASAAAVDMTDKVPVSNTKAKDKMDADHGTVVKKGKQTEKVFFMTGSGPIHGYPRLAIPKITGGDLWAGRESFRKGHFEVEECMSIPFQDRKYKDLIMERLFERRRAQTKVGIDYIVPDIVSLIRGGPLNEEGSGKEMFFHPNEYEMGEEPANVGFKDCPDAVWRETVFSTVLLYLTRGLTTRVLGDIIDFSMQGAAPKWINEQGRNSHDLVWGIGNSVCAESLRLLRKAFATKQNWLLMLTSRPCEELGRDGIEFVIPVQVNNFELYFVHLISVRDGEEAGEVVRKMLDAISSNWEAKLGGFYSHVPRADVERKAVEDKVIEALKRCNGVSKDVLMLSAEEGHDWKSLLPYQVAELTKEDLDVMIRPLFRQFMNSSLETGEMTMREILRKEQQHLKKLYVSLCQKRRYGKAWRKSANNETQLFRFLNGLQAIWRQGKDWFNMGLGRLRCGVVGQGGGVVDACLERVFRGRSLVLLRHVGDRTVILVNRGVKSRKSNCEMGHIMGANWSNIRELQSW